MADEINSQRNFWSIRFFRILLTKKSQCRQQKAFL